MNAWAEALRFADREFYEDWWNSRSFSGYYRKWNLIIHDWCYAYVYRELGGGALPAFLVFLLSSLVHEFVLIGAHRFFYPVLFVLYTVFGVAFFFVSRALRSGGSAWNVAMWFNLMIGNGMIIAFHSMEWFARKNCRPSYEGAWDLIIPRSWACLPRSP
jgi:sterol O-acyltransferase